MKRIRHLAPLVVLIAAGLVMATAWPVRAAGDVIAVGWWTRLPTASAPEGGINVGSAPDGPNSVAAIQIDLGDGLSSLQISAVEAGGAPQAAVIRACPAAEGWAPEPGGALEDAPDIDCTNSVRFTRADDGLWSADVGALAAGRTGTMSIGLLAHGPSGDGPLSVTPSEVQFEAPTATGTPATTTTPTTTGSFTPPPTAPSSPSAPSGPAIPSPPPASSPTISVAPPTTRPAIDTAEPTVDEPATTATTIGLTEERALDAVTASDVGSDGGRPIGEAFFLLFLAGLVGVAVGGASKFAALRA